MQFETDLTEPTEIFQEHTYLGTLLTPTGSFTLTRTAVINTTRKTEDEFITYAQYISSVEKGIGQSHRSILFGST